MTPVFYILGILVLLTAFFKTSLGKGILGETLVNLAVKLLLNKKRCFFLKDVILPCADGTTQIDHIIVSAYGIFVLETKNMKGWIFGSEQGKVWTQKTYNHTNTFQNPLRQNWKHVKAVESLLRIDPEKVFSLVAFVGAGQFKTPVPENVTQGMGFIHFIKGKKKILLSPEDCLTAITLINERRLDNNHKTNQAHLHYLNRKHDNKKGGSRKSIILLQAGLALLLILAIINFLTDFRAAQIEETPLSLNPVQERKNSKTMVPDKKGENEVIYRWVDEYGKIHYSNVGVPDGYKAIRLEPRGENLHKE